MTAPVRFEDPEQERLRKARLWESMVRAGTPPELATVFVEAGKGLPSESQPLPDPKAGVGRWLGLTARSALNAAGDVGGMLMSGPTGMGSSGPEVISALAQKQGNMLGLPQPETGFERMATQTTRGGMSGIPLGPAGIISGALGGAAQQGTAELGFGPIPQLLAALTGGVVGGKLGQGVERRMGPQARSADAIRRAFETEGLSPEAELTKAGQKATQSPGMPLREAGGRPTQSVALRTASEGGTGGRRVAQAAAVRLAELKDRFVAQTTRVMGGKANVNTEAQIDAKYKPQVDKAYDAVRYEMVDLTPEIIAKIDEPGIIRAINKGVDLYNESAGARGAPKIPYVTDGFGNFRDRVPLAVLDEVQRGYAAEGAAIADAGQARVHASRAEDIAKAISGEVEKQVKGYPVARALHREHMGLQEAIAFGRGLVGSPATRSLTRGVVNPAKRVDPNEASIVWGKMTPEERLLAKQAVVDGVERAPNPVAALKRAMQSGRFIFTPDELQSIESIVSEGAETMQSARQVVAANRAKPLRKDPGLVRRIVIDIVAAMRRTIVRDADQLANEGPMFTPGTREALADFLNSTGRQAVSAADATATRIGYQRTAPARGTLAGVAPAALGRDRREER